MIGQNNILNWVEHNIDNLPHFIVFIGDKGTGKTMISKEIAKKLDANFIISGIKVDDIREVISNGYSVKDKVVYCIKDGDTMRAEAKNAMLKITEEPPKNAYFILTVVDSGTLLDTIKSRGMVFRMEPYSKEELKEYSEKYSNIQNIETILNIASSPYDVDMLIKYGPDFIDYVNLVIDNIGVVEPANAFKSGSKLALKDNEEDKYDLKLFLKTFEELSLARLEQNPILYANTICITDPYIIKLNKLGVNRQQVYDMWVFDVRRAFYESES